ncbi:UNVERIFIED_CONTAM: Serine/threonine-protein kinase pak-1 [Sesamum radiatum]|uniref:Serine/threonine-protein kinase pak-1 n=1 Tax=Sesamum radiatum TaxID=300843 RepID=A0AAW2SK98_SESRA
MKVKELELIETPDCKKQEISGRIQDSDALEERCDKKDFKVESVVDVSGKTLDFPLINGEERMVEEVYMYKNELNLIPTAMGRLKNLKTLKFFSNAVNLFPREFGNLVELECLQVKVSEPGINGLEVSKLTNLKELELSRVPPRLSAFPLLSDIAGLKCLTRLSVCHFSIRYIPLSRVCASVVPDRDASPNCSFPSLAVCDEIGKLASTSLMRCTVGSLEAAVKVRTIEVSEASADEVRNFEFSCLGEVRILTALKHSCIIECYGHQISSKWLETANGNFGRRILQSAILMEYIRGGSLKGYVEKLSSAGEKHVAPDLALSIARDVAFALSELHSRHIIHRDIKSENILIDLEKQQPDGTPIVKICDFDRAIPLHSYLHTCCIAHVGIPRPDICVGTPRWMAPEVFCAMHEQNIYGLEVDIWSFGCMLLELLTLQVPYSELPESEIHRFLQMGERPKLTNELEELAESEADLETESETLRFLAKLYHQCTEKNPYDRPSAKNIYNMLLTHERSVKGSRSSEQE